jgi:hypothetical protein
MIITITDSSEQQTPRLFVFFYFFLAETAACIITCIIIYMKYCDIVERTQVSSIYTDDVPADFVADFLRSDFHTPPRLCTAIHFCVFNHEANARTILVLFLRTGDKCARNTN